MSDLRADREQAYWHHWRRSLRESPRDGLPAFLDALEAIDREHNMSELPRTGAEAAEWALPAAPVKPATRRRAAPKGGAAT